MYHYGEGSSSQHGGYGGGSQNGGYGGGSSFADEGPTELLALGTSTGQIAIFNLAANAMVAQHQIAGGHRIHHVKFSNDGQRVYATNDRRLYEFSAEDLALKQRVRHVKFSDDGQKVYPTNNRRLYEFSAENLTLRAYFQDQGHIADFSLNLDEHALYTCSSGAIRIWDCRVATCALSRSVGEYEMIATDVTWTRNISSSEILSLAVTLEANARSL